MARKLYDYDVDAIPNSPANTSGRIPSVKPGMWTSNNPTFYTYSSYALSTEKPLDGHRNSLQHTMFASQEGKACRLKLEFTVNDGVNNLFLRDVIENAQGTPAWTDNTYNRMRMAVYVPAGTPPPPDNEGRINASIKLYLKHPEGSGNSQQNTINVDGEEVPGEPYYYYRHGLIEDTWQFYQVEDHCQHIRGETGAWYPLSYPYANSQIYTPLPEYTFIDAISYMFFQTSDGIDESLLPFTSYFAPHEIYAAHADEDTEYVCSLTGAYHPGTGELAVSWSVKRYANYLCDIKYAYSDIYTLGWDNATDAPNGQNLNGQNNDYNAMEYRTSAIPAGGNQYIYIAIRSQAQPEGKFNQIVLPLTENGYPPFPGAAP